MARIEPINTTTKDGIAIRVRTVDPLDAEPLLALFDHVTVTSNFNVMLPGEPGTTVEDMRERIEKFSDTDNRLMLVATHADRLVGEIAFHGRPPFRMQHGGHFGIGIHAAWRGRGLGRILIQTLLDWATAHPTIEKIRLGVLADNHHAIALYTSMGFVEDGRHEGEFKFGPDKYIDDIQMVQWVKPRKV